MKNYFFGCKSARLRFLLIAALLSLTADTGVAQTVSFAPAANFGAGTGPRSAAIADFNGDGKLDMAVANNGSGTVSILLGAGDGSFGAAASVAGGSAPNGVIAGDFNGDGNLDLAVANFGDLSPGSGSVAILLGTGSGAFGPATDFAVGSHPYQLAAGDFNGDGKLDIAMTQFSNTIAVILGAGNGTFGAPTTFPINHSNSVSLGDFNRDGKFDLAVTDSSNNTVSIFLGVGDGTFGAPTSFGAGTTPDSIAVGDFNKDGKFDLVIANSGSDDVSLLLGNGDGTFGSASNFSAGTIPRSVTIGDFNGDGKLDVAVANEGDASATPPVAGAISILLGNGTGSFGSRTNFSAGSEPQFVAVGNFNGDGKPDLVVANEAGNNVSILLNASTFTPVGTFGAATHFSVGTRPFAGAAGDFNGDGKLDLAVANANVNTVSLLLGNGDGTFAAAADFEAGAFPIFVAVGDFNRDGMLDLAVANSNSNNVSILLGKGDGTFHESTEFGAGNGPYSVAVGDFNSDGALDLAVANSNSNNVSILLGRGDGSFDLLDYPIAEGDETVIVTLAPGTGYTVGSPNNATVTITDNDAPTVTIAATDNTATESGPTTGTFTLTRSGPTTSPLIVNYTVAGTAINGTDYAPLSGSVTIAADSATATITVTPIDDAEAEGDETVIVTLASGPGYAVGSPNSATVIITGGGAPAVTIAATDSTATESGPTTGTFTLTRSGPTTSPLTVNYTVAGTAINGTDYALLSGSVTIAAGSATATITLSPIDDIQAEGDETVILTLASGTGYVVGLPNSDAATITDNEVPTVTIAATDSTATESGPTTGTFTLTRSGPTTSPLTVNYTVAGTAINGTDYAPLSGSVTIAAGSATATITVSPIHDSVGSSPSSVATGDFNRDGALDLAVANFGGNVSILLGNGDGTFAPATNLAVGTSPRSVAAGDFNRDGALDLAVADFNGDVFILLGDGSGAFVVLAKSVAAGSAPVSVAVGDFNRDGMLDLAVANEFSDDASLLSGNGDGTFEAARNFDVGIVPISVAVGDFNRDGTLDLAVANYNSNNVSVLLNGFFALTLANTTLRNGEVNVVYNEALVNGGLGPYIFTLTKGAFPAGLNPNAATGRLSGSPTASSNKAGSFTVKITDQLGASVTGSFKLKIASALSISTTALKAGTTGKSYKGTLKLKGGTGPYVWSVVAGSLPAGLTLNSSSGAISGKPTETGTFNPTFRVTDSAGGSAEQLLPLTIN